MIESKAFDEMNVTYPIEPDAEPFSPGSPNAADTSTTAPSGILQKIKYKFKRQVSFRGCKQLTTIYVCTG